MVSAAVRYKESPVDVASWNFSSACGRLALDADLKTLLAMPYRELSLQLPIRMDDGTLRVFRASRVLHSNARGPALGDLRLKPRADANLAFALANATTWTSAVMNIPFGGACGVIDCDPESLSTYEHEKLLRRFASRSHVVLGPFQDVAIASSEAEAALLLDEYSSLHGFTPACVVGKDIQHGGVADSSKARPRAAALALYESAIRLDRKIQDLTIAILATPDSAADYLAEFASMGCTVVALGDGVLALHNRQGINPSAISESLNQIPHANDAGDSVLSAECDVLVLASAECTVHAMNAARVSASIVLEAAPLSVTPSADVILRQQRTMVVPDLVGASGAIIAAHVEWSANLEKKQLRKRDVEAALEKSIPVAIDAVFERTQRDHSSLRSAAYCIAVERVARTERLRGI